MIMPGFFYKLLIWVMPIITQMIACCSLSGFSWCGQDHFQRPDVKFKQRTGRYWMFDEKSQRWMEMKLPFDLESCVDGKCTKVGSIEPIKHDDESKNSSRNTPRVDGETKDLLETPDPVLPFRKRISLTKMSETSIWITGVSGSVYERFWNGVQWVIAPHELPILSGRAVSLFIVKQTILALSESGGLYQLQLGENSQPFWSELKLPSDVHINSSLKIKSGLASHDEERLLFATRNGLLIELHDIQTSEWINHGHPPGGSVAALVGVDIIRPGIVFTVSYSGDLYEFDKISKPFWKKHIWNGASTEKTLLSLVRGYIVRDSLGAKSFSLFLLTKNGDLLERRLHKRKWKWISHGAPNGHNLTAITPCMHNDKGEKNDQEISLFFTTATGLIFEYQPSKHSGSPDERNFPETWINHLHPPQAKAAKGIPGLQLQHGRIFFPLDDGRLAELHWSGIGGESSGPIQQSNLRRRPAYKYEWTVLESPETEGWNAEYCTNERGPTNCIMGVKDTPARNNDGIEDTNNAIPTRKRKDQHHESYFLLSTSGKNHSSSTPSRISMGEISSSFHMRTILPERSIFLATEDGLAFEYLFAENVWIWLGHDHLTSIKGALGSYNGSLFLFDSNGNLFSRERNGNEFSWLNCTGLKNGKAVVAGAPWDVFSGSAPRATADDSLFLISKTGKLLQFTVAFRKFKWKDCHAPPNTKIAHIVDQETFRSNVVFVIGRNGKLYQYNKVTGLWHQHNQSPHLVLFRSSGTTVRPSLVSLTGSLFMFSEQGGLIEYHYNSFDGWEWIEHGTPSPDISFVGAPGPSFDGSHLFLVGFDGNVYLRYLEGRFWKWKNYFSPSSFSMNMERLRDKTKTKSDINQLTCSNQALHQSLQNSDFQNENCDDKVSPIRPVKLSSDSIIFMLKDGRLGEMRRTEEMEWRWSRIIVTPASSCTQFLNS